jgi:hypothetical protein
MLETHCVNVMFILLYCFVVLKLMSRALGVKKLVGTLWQK